MKNVKEYFYLCLTVKLGLTKFYIKNASGNEILLTTKKEDAFQGGLVGVNEIQSILNSYFKIKSRVENV